MLSKPQFVQSREATILIDIMRERSGDERPLITLREIEDAVGKRVNEVRAQIGTAIRHMRRHHGQVWKSDRNIGYRLVPDAEMGSVLEDERKRGYRIDRIALEKAECADTTKMGRDEQTKFYLNKTVLEMRHSASRPRLLSNLSQTVLRKHNELSMEEIVEAIKASLKK